MVFLTFSIINFVNFIITPKASKLIEYVRGADEDFTLPRISCKSIAKEILRSKTTLKNVLRLKNEYERNNC